MTDAEWLVERGLGITGSDTAAICGLHPHKSAFAVWTEKMGHTPPLIDNLVLKRGRYLEPFIAAEYAEQHGLELIKPEPRLVTHPVFDWQKGSPDYYIKGSDEGLEVKDVGYREAWRWGGSEYGDASPAAFLQSHWYLGITDRPGWRIAAMISGQEIRHYTCQRDPDLFGMLQEVARQFRVDHIQTGVPPPVDGHISTVRAIRDLFPDQTLDTMSAQHGLTPWAQKWIEADAQLAEWEERKNEAASQIKLGIKGSAGVYGDGWKATWKKTRDGTKTDWEAVAKEAAASQALIKKHTEKRPGYRRFLLTAKGYIWQPHKRSN